MRSSRRFRRPSLDMRGAVAEVADELAGERLRAVAGVEEAVEDGRGRRRSCWRGPLEHCSKTALGTAPMRSRTSSAESAGAPPSTGARGDGLVHDGERVAHGAVAGFG